MSMKNWLKAGALSTALGLTAATGAMAQESEEPKGEKTEVVQQQDYSAIKADRAEIIVDGQEIQPKLAQRLIGTPIENAQDVYDANTKIQDMLDQNNTMLSRIMRVQGITMTDTTEVTVNGYNGNEKVVSFDADDAPEIEETPEAAPTQRRGSEQPARGRGRGVNVPSNG